jgi:nucleotide-binding universal stress UspA family protein
VTQPILVGYCPESLDRSPVDFAADAGRFTGAPLVVAVVHPGGSPLARLAGGEFHHQPDGDDGEAVEHLRSALLAEGVAAEFHAVEHSTPARGLAAAIEELRPALIVLGSSSRTRAGHVMPGSTAERVIHGAPCPVAVVPRGHERPADGVRVVGAAVSPTPEGREALRAAALLARAAGARVRAVMALNPKRAAEQSPGMLAAQHHDREAAEDIAARHRLDAQDDLKAAIAELGPGVEVETDVLYQHPAHALVAASANLDLLVMGSRAYGPLRSVVLGGVSRKVAAAAGCPVLVLPRGTEGAIEALLQAARPASGELSSADQARST